MKVELVLNDWKKIGCCNSIYNTDLGVQLSSGDLHSGTIFEAEINFKDQDIADEIKRHWDKHKAYPVFNLIITGD